MHNRFLQILALLLFIGSIVACNDDDRALETDLTGRKLVYNLVSGSDYNVDGSISFEEKKDGGLRASISIGATGESAFHPAHIHYGPYAKDAEMATMLNPVDGETGKSTTDIDMLADGSRFDFEALKEFDGHVKIHGDDGPNKDLILAYGNIGKNMNNLSAVVSASISLCK